MGIEVTPTKSRSLKTTREMSKISFSTITEDKDERTRSDYSLLSRRNEKEQIIHRRDQVLLAQLRSGHHLIFQSYQNKLDETIDPLCPLCREEPHTVGHWLGRCSSTVEMRKSLEKMLVWE